MLYIKNFLNGTKAKTRALMLASMHEMFNYTCTSLRVLCGSKSDVKGSFNNNNNINNRHTFIATFIE